MTFGFVGLEVSVLKKTLLSPWHTTVFPYNWDQRLLHERYKLLINRTRMGVKVLLE